MRKLITKTKGKKKSMPKLNKLCSYICIINRKMEVKAKSVTDKGTCYLKMISCEWKNHNFNYFFPLSNVVSKYINNDRKESESYSLSHVQLFCDPMNCSLPCSSVHWILQARFLEWVAYSSPGDLPYRGIEPRCPELQADSLHLSHQGSPI